MLVELKKLNIINEGYKRVVSLDRIYVNPSHIISVRDYDNANDFLLQEGMHNYANNKFSLVRMSNVSTVEEVIVLGSSEDIYNSIQKPSSRELLNG